MENRITEIESRISFIENTLNELNAVVTQQDSTILKLEKLNKRLVLQIESLGESINTDSGHELPPHY